MTKGEIVNVSRHAAYYELLPQKLAVYPTEEYLEMFKKDRESAATKAKVSPYALNTQQELSSLLLLIPMNMAVEWTLNKDHVRVAFRYNVIAFFCFSSRRLLLLYFTALKKIMCQNDNILFADGLEVTSKNYQKVSDPFVVEIKVSN